MSVLFMGFHDGAVLTAGQLNALLIFNWLILGIVLVKSIRTSL